MNAQEKEKYFSEIYLNNRDKILRLCYAFIPNNDDSEDLFHEIMIKVWNNLDQFQNKSNITTWIYRISVNTALFYKQKRFKYVHTDIENINIQLAVDDNIGQKNEIERDIENLYKAISLLEKHDRLIVSMQLEGISYDDISDTMGISVNYVGVKIIRIKAQLLKLLTK